MSIKKIEERNNRWKIPPLQKLKYTRTSALHLYQTWTLRQVEMFILNLAVDSWIYYIDLTNLQANDEDIRNFFSDVGGVQDIRILLHKFTGKSRVSFSHPLFLLILLCALNLQIHASAFLVAEASQASFLS